MATNLWYTKYMVPSAIDTYKKKCGILKQAHII